VKACSKPHRVAGDLTPHAAVGGCRALAGEQEHRRREQATNNRAEEAMSFIRIEASECAPRGEKRRWCSFNNPMSDYLEGTPLRSEDDEASHEHLQNLAHTAAPRGSPRMRSSDPTALPAAHMGGGYFRPFFFFFAIAGPAPASGRVWPSASTCCLEDVCLPILHFRRCISTLIE
jgi:hypothetical protein